MRPEAHKRDAIFTRDAELMSDTARAKIVGVSCSIDNLRDEDISDLLFLCIGHRCSDAFDCDASTSVEDIKMQLAERTGLKGAELSFNGRVLEVLFLWLL